MNSGKDKDPNHFKTLTFIENYKSFVELWDVSHKDYNNKNKRKDALECLAINHNMSIPEVKNKIKCLRSYFSKEHHKVQQNKDEGYESTWFAYDSMSFIQDYQKKSKAIEEHELALQHLDEEVPVTADDNRTQLLLKSQVRKGKLKRLRPNLDDDSTYNPQIHTFPKISSPLMRTAASESLSPVKADEFSIFGQMVATQIKKFSRRNQAIARNTIQNFLFDMEMREMATEENPAPAEIIIQSLTPSSPRLIGLKNGESIHTNYATSGKLEDVVVACNNE